MPTTTSYVPTTTDYVPTTTSYVPTTTITQNLGTCYSIIIPIADLTNGGTLYISYHPYGGSLINQSYTSYSNDTPDPNYFVANLCSIEIPYFERNGVAVSIPTATINTGSYGCTIDGECPIQILPTTTIFDNCFFGEKSINIISTTTAYIPTTTSYIPTTAYAPTTTTYVPTTTVYLPTTTTTVYLPTTTTYVPTTTVYLPTTTTYVPTTTVYVTDLVVDASPTSASIGVVGESDWFSFTTNAAGNYTMRTFGTTDLYMQLYGSNKKLLIAGDDDSGGNLQPLITQSLTAYTQYFLKVYYYNGNGTGNYTIQVYTGVPTTTVAPTTTAAPSEYYYMVNSYACDTCALVQNNLLVIDNRNDLNLHSYYSDGASGLTYRITQTNASPGGIPSAMTGIGVSACASLNCI